MSDQTSPGRGPKRRELLKRGALATGAATVGVAGFAGTSLAGCDAVSCPRTQGYWKNHWPWSKDWFDLGYGTVSDDTALDILNQPPKGDKCVIMEKQLIAALLNVYEGTHREEFDVSCVNAGDPSTIERAQSWLAENCGGDSEVKGRWPGDGEAIKDRLDAFNNGRLCPEGC